MNKTDANVLYEVAELMRKCPNISPNPYAIAGTVNACRDFQKINQLVYELYDLTDEEIHIVEDVLK